MGILIGAESIGHEWPGKHVLEGQTVGVNEGDRIGIVGRNGDGKTTLLGLLAKRFEPDSGSVTWRNNIHVGLLSQDDDLDDESTVIRAVVGDVPDYVWATDAGTRAIMDELLADIDPQALVGTLSGGQRRRCDLARLLVQDWDVLCLDEPTNHLDMHAIAWLAEHLKRRWPAGQGALLTVTHDRWFLDEVCTSMWEVHDRRVEPFEGGYSAYIQQRVERERQAAVAEERRQNTLRKELNWLAHGAKARTSKPKFRIKEAQALIADDPPLRNPLELKRLAVSRLGKQVIELKGACRDFGSNHVFGPIDWIIGPGERVGILGENGAGKTTLLKVMMGQLEPTAGRVKIGKSVRLGQLSQHLTSLSDKEDWRVRDLLARTKHYVVIDGREVTPSQLLERLGFDSRELMTYVADLSGGQRRRLALMLLLIEEPNVLVLDEPGNDLDTDMLAVMEDLLDTWPGTLVIVTHDRYLMERVTDDQYALIDGSLSHVPRGVDEYLKRLGSAPTGERFSRRASSDSTDEPMAEKSQETPRLSNKERRELKRRFDSCERKLEKASGEPDRIRAELEAADATDYEELTRLTSELEAARARIDELETEWLELSEQLGQA